MSIRRVVVIGAARSGTKALRDSLAAATGFGRVPYDIGYVWRVADPGAHDDALDPRRLTHHDVRFIRRFIDGYCSETPAGVVEKTVGNALRVDYVAAVLPDACFVHVIRDGADVAVSARREWLAPTDASYLSGKLRHVPLRVLPRYGVRYVLSRLARERRADGRVGSWGPRYPGIDSDLRELDLLAVCARQWTECVSAATAALTRLDRPVAELRYEDFASDPKSSLARVIDELGLPDDGARISRAAEAVTSDRVGAGRSSLLPEESRLLSEQLGGMLRSLGYRPLVAADTVDAAGTRGEGSALSE